MSHQHAAAHFMYPLMEFSERYGIVVVVYYGHNIPNNPYIVDIANSFPEVKLGILHMGGGTCFDLELFSTKMAVKNNNIYLEMCYSNPVAIKQAVKAIGSEKVIYGSESSNGGHRSRFEKAGNYIELMLDSIRFAGITKVQKDEVVGDSVENLLGIDA